MIEHYPHGANNSQLKPVIAVKVSSSLRNCNGYRLHAFWLCDMKYLLLLFLIFSRTAHAGMPEGYAAYARGNYAEAFTEFSVAAKQDYPAAQNMLASMYAQGKGVQRDYKQALDWLYRAQALGSPEAMYNLARMHEEGLGEPRNPAAALKYYLEAAYLGFQPAIQRLKQLKEQGALTGALASKNQSNANGNSVRVLKSTNGTVKAGSGSSAKPLTEAKRQAPAPASTLSAHTVRKLYVGANDARPALGNYLHLLRKILAKHLAVFFAAERSDTEIMASVSIQKDGRISRVEATNRGSLEVNDKVVGLIKKMDRLPPLPKTISAEFDELDVSIKLPGITP
jgi:hypothetical protein